jgi:hypothetical protein
MGGSNETARTSLIYTAAELEKRSDVTLCGILALSDGWPLVKVSDEMEKWGRNEK